MKSTLQIFAAVLTLGLATAGQVASHAPVLKGTSISTATNPLERPVARVNGVALTERDVLRQMMNIFPYARQHGGRFPKDTEAEIRKQAMQQIEFEELVYQEALRRKLVIPPAKLQRAVADFKKQFDTEADFRTYLKQEQGNSLQSLRNKIRRAILIDEFLNAEVNRKARLTNAELQSFYAKNQQRFRKPESISLQTISIVIPEKGTAKEKENARSRAEDALRRAKATKTYEEFGSLAEKVSEDDWRVMMGDHKTLHRGRMPAPVEKAAFAMQSGQVSDLIDTGDSYCIARVNGREDSKLVPFPEVRPQLKKDLEAEKAAELQKGLEARLRKSAKVEEL